jgi:homocitrate synthase NifV
MLGRAHEIVIGKHSGSAAVTAMLRRLDLSVSVEELGEIVSCVRAHALDHKGPVSGEALTSIWRNVCASTHARGM